jgi:long-subunit acyl-CoA synthetase (AMP-forming)
MLSHANLVAETYLMALPGREWVQQQTEAGTYQPKELTTLAHLPVSHIAGLFGYLIFPLYSGGTVYWMRKYEWNTMLRHLKEYKVSAFYTVPSIWLRISKSDEITDHFQNVEGASTGAAPMDSKLQRAATARVGDGKSHFIGVTYGLSETTGAITAMPKGETDDTGSTSPLLPCVELRMVDDDFKDVEPGQEGELIVRSPLVTRGYYENAEATKNSFHGDWFLTGDIAVMRDGKFYIVDRKKVTTQPHPGKG